jgi:hypothetical protein
MKKISLLFLTLIFIINSFSVSAESRFSRTRRPSGNRTLMHSSTGGLYHGKHLASCSDCRRVLEKRDSAGTGKMKYHKILFYV